MEGFLSPVAPVAGGIAGGFIQCMLEDGEIDDMDLVFMGMAAVPGPKVLGVGGKGIRNLAMNAGTEYPEDVVRHTAKMRKCTTNRWK